MKLINFKAAEESLKKMQGEFPFDHCVIDNFFEHGIAQALSDEFPDFESSVWHEYNNPLEIKKTCNNWNFFGSETYKVLEFFNSSKFIKFLETYTKITPLYPDPGLNGGGWHIHSSGGRLNPHLDYSMHPKINKQRVLNILIYLTPDWDEQWGGNLGLWSKHPSKNLPGKLEKSISPIFNRAILFNTTQDSWHGLAEKVKCPSNYYRRSLAVYYLTNPQTKTSKRSKALFAPVDQQKHDKSVLELIKKRSNSVTTSSVYKTGAN